MPGGYFVTSSTIWSFCTAGKRSKALQHVHLWNAKKKEWKAVEMNALEHLKLGL